MPEEQPGVNMLRFTDWKRNAALYWELNRAVAVAMAEGPAIGLTLVVASGAPAP
jgi:predicted RNA polymerase sigma factor